MLKRETAFDKLFLLLAYSVSILFGIICLIPFLHELAISLSGPLPVLARKVDLIPKDFTLRYYFMVFENSQFIRSLSVTVFITIVGTFLNVALTTFTAYPLSKRWLPYRTQLMYFIMIPMLFSGGLIPLYLALNSMKLINTVWVMILPGLISSFYLIILKTIMEGIPESLEESAKIDGASPFVILFKIIIPLSKAGISTLVVFYSVYNWNMFSYSVYFTHKSSLWTLQVYIKQMLDFNITVLKTGMITSGNVTPESATAATLMLSAIPIILVYPFMQKYFVKGVKLGSLKG